MAVDDLLEICRRAGLEPAADAACPQSDGVVCRSAFFMGAELVVAAAADVLDRCLEQAAGEVPLLWPGRHAHDGALALLSTSLQAAVESRRQAPRSMTLSADGSWQATPTESFPESDLPPSSWQVG